MLIIVCFFNKNVKTQQQNKKKILSRAGNRTSLDTAVLSDTARRLGQLNKLIK